MILAYFRRIIAIGAAIVLCILTVCSCKSHNNASASSNKNASISEDENAGIPFDPKQVDTINYYITDSSDELNLTEESNSNSSINPLIVGIIGLGVGIGGARLFAGKSKSEIEAIKQKTDFEGKFKKLEADVETKRVEIDNLRNKGSLNEKELSNLQKDLDASRAKLTEQQDALKQADQQKTEEINELKAAQTAKEADLNNKIKDLEKELGKKEAEVSEEVKKNITSNLTSEKSKSELSDKKQELEIAKKRLESTKKRLDMFDNFSQFLEIDDKKLFTKRKEKDGSNLYMIVNKDGTTSQGKIQKVPQNATESGIYFRKEMMNADKDTLMVFSSLPSESNAERILKAQEKNKLYKIETIGNETIYGVKFNNDSYGLIKLDPEGYKKMSRPDIQPAK